MTSITSTLSLTADDEHGQLVFTQNIFRDGYAGFPIRDWRLVKHSGQQPYYDQTHQAYRVDWHDGVALRTVWAKEVRHTWLQYDPEVAERESFPKLERRELTAPIKRTRNE